MADNQKIGRDAAKKALKAFYRTAWMEADEDLGEIVAEETDRGAVILMATVVEDMLGAAIRKRMDKLSPDEDARLFGPDAPLGTFSAKIRIAHALGIIKREQMAMCDILREMRNACAHSRRAISFKNKVLRDMLGVAMSPIFADNFTDDLHDMHDAAPMILKLYLLWVCGWLIRYMRSGSEEAATSMIQQMVDEAQQSILDAAASHEKRRTRSRKGRPGSHKVQPQKRPPRSSRA